jgi:hypothetical protein
MISSMTTFVLLAAMAQKTDDFQFDFRNAHFDPALFKYSFSKPAHEKWITHEPEGLRITLPSGAADGPVGLLLQTPMQGNFDATVAYEILSGDRGNKEIGPNANLYIRFQGPSADGISFGRAFRSDGDFFYCSHIIDNPDEPGKRKLAQWAEAPADKNVLSGKLRFSRQGTKLLAQFSEANGPFRGVAPLTIDDAPVSWCRIAAEPKNKWAIDLRFLNLTVSPVTTAALPAPPSPPQSRLFWAAMALILLFAILALTVTVKRATRGKMGQSEAQQ